MLRNRLILLPIIFLILLFNIIHTHIISESIDQAFIGLSEKGFSTELLSDEKSFFQTKKHFLLHLSKGDLASKALFKLQAKEPFSIFLSTMEGLTLDVLLTHNHYTFSHEFKLSFHIVNLPEHFSESSLLLNHLVNFTKTHQDTFQISFDILSENFKLTIPKIETHILADNNVSYDISMHEFALQGFLHDYNNLQLKSHLKDLSLKIKEADTERLQLMIDQANLEIMQQEKESLVTLDLNKASAHILTDQESSIEILDLHTKQTQRTHPLLDIHSLLTTKQIQTTIDQNRYALENFSYDIALNQIDQTILQRMSHLINSSNQSEVLFVFDEFSKEIQNLLKTGTSIEIKTLTFDKIIFKNQDYKEASLTLKAALKPEHFMEFFSKIHLSTEIYELFLESIPNANVTKNYLTDPNQIDFTLELTPLGLRFNDQLLVQEEENKENNSTVIDAQTEEESDNEEGN